MTSQQPTEKLIELIKRLLALSTSSNEYEAANAAAKAQELLLQHNLAMADIETKEEQEDVTRINIEAPVRWASLLLSGIAASNLCRTCLYDNGAKTAIIGSPSNIEIVEFMFVYLAEEIDRLARTKCKGQGTAYRKSWKLGAVSTIRARLRDGLAQFQTDPTGRALVLAREAPMMTMYVREFPHTTQSRPTMGNSDAGYYAGKTDAHNIAIRQGIKSQSSSAYQLPPGR